MLHRLVILESPFAGKTPEELAANIDYARRAVRDSLMRGESPVASHLLFTQPGILRDDVPEERRMGIMAGLAWGKVAHAAVVYTDRGISEGMRLGIGLHEAQGLAVEYRQIGKMPATPPPKATSLCQTCAPDDGPCELQHVGIVAPGGSCNRYKEITPL